MKESKLDLRAIRTLAKSAKKEIEKLPAYQQEAIRYVSNFAASEQARKTLNVRI